MGKNAAYRLITSLIIYFLSVGAFGNVRLPASPFEATVIK
jgi:hypothetical protein